MKPQNDTTKNTFPHLKTIRQLNKSSIAITLNRMYYNLKKSHLPFSSEIIVPLLFEQDGLWLTLEFNAFWSPVLLEILSEILHKDKQSSLQLDDGVEKALLFSICWDNFSETNIEIYQLLSFCNNLSVLHAVAINTVIILEIYDKHNLNWKQYFIQYTKT